MFPLKRIKFSNEKLQAYLFVALVVNLVVNFRLQLLSPANFITVLVITLVVDAVLNFIRYKKVLCSVSAGITASVIAFLLPGIPLGYQIIASLAAIVIGKHIWGGTGKNPVNPALLGVFIVSLLIKPGEPQVTLFVLLCIPFIAIRLLPVIAFIASSYTVYLLTGEWSWITIFLAFVAVTDPVTVKDGVVSAVIIFTVNSLVLFLFNNPILSILLINTVQFTINKIKPDIFKYRYRPLKINPIFKVKENKGISFPFDQDLDIKNDADLLQILKDTQINGQGGASFPLLTKINSLKGGKKVLIVNGAECDPGLYHDKFLMDHLSVLLEETACFLQDKLNIDQAYIASKQDRFFKKIEHIKLKNYYPVGYEKMVIKEVTGEIIPKDAHPTEMGYLIVNVQTLLQLYLVLTNQDHKNRFITLCNLDNNEAKVVNVRNGETVGELLERFNVNSNKVYIGGGLMAASPGDKDITISDSINSIFYGNPDFFKESPQCSLCGLCMKVCPVGINPSLEEKDEKCIRCGACSYVCLAGRKLSTRIN